MERRWRRSAAAPVQDGEGQVKHSSQELKQKIFLSIYSKLCVLTANRAPPTVHRTIVASHSADTKLVHLPSVSHTPSSSWTRRCRVSARPSHTGPCLSLITVSWHVYHRSWLNTELSHWAAWLYTCMMYIFVPVIHTQWKHIHRWMYPVMIQVTEADVWRGPVPTPPPPPWARILATSSATDLSNKTPGLWAFIHAAHYYNTVFSINLL